MCLITHKKPLGVRWWYVHTTVSYTHLKDEINGMLDFVEQLSEVNVEGIEPMTSVTPMAMKKRADVVSDGNDAQAVLKNAPQSADNFYLVPKVIE